MPDFNAAGVAALAEPVAEAAWIFWLDILGDVQRVTTARLPLTITGTGDVDLDGFTFGTTGALISVGDVVHGPGGAESVTAYLSALPGIDTATLNQLGNKANFQGRIARAWIAVLDPENGGTVSIGAYWTGYMMTPRFVCSKTGQLIALEMESWLAAYAEASGRTYLDQADFDPGDKSAIATLSAVNGFTAGGDGGGGGSGRGGMDFANRVRAEYL